MFVNNLLKYLLQPWYWLLRLFDPPRGFLQFLLFVVPSLFVLVCPLETLATVGRARHPRQVAAVAGGALVLRQHAADDALAGARHDHVRHIQQLRGKDAVIQLELTTKPGQKYTFIVVLNFVNTQVMLFFV